MSSDDLTKEMRDREGKITQPMIADLFRLVEKMQQTMATRFDETNARLDAIEARFALDLAGVEARLSDKMEKEFLQMGDKIDALNRGRLQTEAEQSNILRRIRDLESKAS